MNTPSTAFGNWQYRTIAKQFNHKLSKKIYQLNALYNRLPEAAADTEEIEKRLDEMWQSGIIEETRLMLDAGCDANQLPVKALGYRQAAMVLRGECSIDEGLALAKRETRRFAKRQLTWFRADKSVEWIELPLNDEEFEAVCRKARDFLATNESP